MKSKPIKLSPRQMDVLKWLAGGWRLASFRRNIVEAGGNHLCNVGTMKVLVRCGFAVRIMTGLPHWVLESWEVTDAGKAYYHDHN